MAQQGLLNRGGPVSSRVFAIYIVQWLVESRRASVIVEGQSVARESQGHTCMPAEGQSVSLLKAKFT